MGWRKRRIPLKVDDYVEIQLQSSDSLGTPLSTVGTIGGGHDDLATEAFDLVRDPGMVRGDPDATTARNGGRALPATLDQRLPLTTCPSQGHERLTRVARRREASGYDDDEVSHHLFSRLIRQD